MEKEESNKLIYESPWMQEIDFTDDHGVAILRGTSGSVDNVNDDYNNSTTQIEGSDETP